MWLKKKKGKKKKPNPKLLKKLWPKPTFSGLSSTAMRRIQIYPGFMLVLDHPVSKFWLTAKSVKRGENGKYFSGKFAFIIVTSPVGFEMTFHTNWAKELQKFFFPFLTLRIKPVANYRVEHVCISIGCAFQGRNKCFWWKSYISHTGRDPKKTKGKEYEFGAIAFRKQRRNQDFSGWDKQLKAKAEREARSSNVVLGCFLLL